MTLLNLPELMCPVKGGPSILAHSWLAHYAFGASQLPVTEWAKEAYG